MSALWVLLEVVPLAALALIACAAGLAHQREDVEPEWWSDFEREFGLYVARTAPERTDDAPAPSRPRRPRH